MDRTLELSLDTRRMELDTESLPSQPTSASFSASAPTTPTFIHSTPEARENKRVRLSTVSENSKREELTCFSE